MSMRTFMWCLLSTLAIISTVDACTFLMGDAKDSLVAASKGKHWDYGFRGDDWVGDTWMCKSGKKQSPINLMGSMRRGQANNSIRTKWSYSPMKSNGSNIVVYNNGHTIQVQWDAGVLSSSVTVQTSGNNVSDVFTLNSAAAAGQAKPSTANPIQFHFHTASEHAVNGVFFPLELHIVHVVPRSPQLPGCPATGCLTVTGVVFKLADDDQPNKALDAVFKAMPMREGVKAALPAGTVLDIQALLPLKKSYLLYEGSLTTPPCSEGVLWHVFDEPLSISQEQFNMYSKAVGLKECTLKNPNPTSAVSSQIAGRRRALIKSEEEVHPVLEKLSSFRRGSYSGFVDISDLHTAMASVAPGNARKLRESVAQGDSNPDDWSCKVVSFGFTNRNCQKLNGRNVLAFA